MLVRRSITKNKKKEKKQLGNPKKKRKEKKESGAKKGGAKISRQNSAQQLLFPIKTSINQLKQIPWKIPC